MRLRGILAALVLAALAVFLLRTDRFSFTSPSSTALDLALRSISAREVGTHMRFLADDALEGRAPSTTGGEIAAKYLAAQLSLLGYAPGGDNGTYFQPVPVLESVITPESWVRVGDGPPLTFSSDVVAFSSLADAHVQVSGELVFVGHGIVAPEYRWDDYAGVDVTGKVVLVMVNEPRATADEPTLFAADALTYYGRWTYKFEEAARHGAVGAVLIHTDASATYPWSVVASSWGAAQYSLPPEPTTPTVPFKAWVTERTARTIVAQAGRDLDALRRDAVRRGTAPVPLGVVLSASLQRRIQTRSAPNVIGVLPGTRADEGVLLTAHYDHLGVAPTGEGQAAGADRIFNGAVDNASGVAGVLALARAMAEASAPGPPRRSIYVVFTTAEESGLLGSEYFAAHPPLSLDAFAAAVNVDELNVFGRARDLVLIGVERSTIREIADTLAAQSGRMIALDPDPGQGNFFRSDHFPLVKAGIPAVSLGLPTMFTGADREEALRRRNRFTEHDYHQVSDEVRDDWNPEGAVDDLRLLGRLVWTLANEGVPPRYQAGDPFARQRSN
jgi:Zn-dependent M28 family amino/carboxypeptidase